MFALVWENTYEQCFRPADGINQGTGTPATTANAPINKYFYNLMNALGVKGDATTGFPSKAGTGPVTVLRMVSGASPPTGTSGPGAPAPAEAAETAKAMSNRAAVA